MWAVLNEPGGTAFGSRVPGLDAGGKTGTVQVVGRDAVLRAGVDKSRLEDHAWFAAFAPMDDPKIVVVVFVEHGGHGERRRGAARQAPPREVLRHDARSAARRPRLRPGRPRRQRRRVAAGVSP